jgi:hypothetical protein
MKMSTSVGKMFDDSTDCFFLDENECKYRPCDVFAQCTNTLGSFTCTCYPGYEGDGFTCTGKFPILLAKIIRGKAKEEKNN